MLKCLICYLYVLSIFLYIDLYIIVMKLVIVCIFIGNVIIVDLFL